MYPIIGGRKVEHLLANIEALDITLTPEQIAYIEGILPFDSGFPSNYVWSLELQSMIMKRVLTIYFS
jgi:diketogulonate reductase-like aldo/keto reductase